MGSRLKISNNGEEEEKRTREKRENTAVIKLKKNPN